MFGPDADATVLEEALVVPELARVVVRLRPLAQMVVDAELARALERHARKELGDTLARIVEHLRGDDVAVG